MKNKILKSYVMKQIPVVFEKIKRGDIFRVLYETEDGRTEFSPWQVALEDSKNQEKESFNIKADTVHVVMGRPEIIDIAVREGEMDFLSKTLGNKRPKVEGNLVSSRTIGASTK